jgi:hypothetical protein
MSTPLQKRPYQVFLSHSSADKEVFADWLRDWLSNACGVSVYYDRDAELTGIARQVAKAVDDSQGAIFVLSRNSKRSPWVKTEFDALSEERMQHEEGEFRIVGIQIDDDDEPFSLLKGVKVLKASSATLAQDDAMILLESLFGGGDPSRGKPLYLSRGWHDHDLPVAGAVHAAINDFDFRVVRDWPVHANMDKGRIERLIGCCGAFVAVLPSRSAEESTTSRYVLKELAWARDHGLPFLVFSAPEVTIDPRWDFPVFQLSPELVSKAAFKKKFAAQLEALEADWRDPPLGKHVFVGHSDAGKVLKPMNRMISRLTGLPVVYGRTIQSDDVPVEIVKSIREAEFCIIDITNPYPNPNAPPKVNYALNSSIEVGIAMGAGKPYYLTCHGEKERSPPFMFDRAQLNFYNNELELAGLVGSFCLRHRRLVVR